MSTHTHSHHSSNHNHNHTETSKSAAPLLTVPDFNGDGNVDNADIRDIIARYEAVEGDELYHPLYDTNINGEIDSYDIENVIHALGENVPLIDQQIAQATQATMKYYGADGLENAIANGYIPFTQEVEGHGIHYFNASLAIEIANSKESDIKRPVGLNYDFDGNLLAVFYIRVPNTQEVTPDNPLGNLMVDSADDFPPSSFNTLNADDWHIHQNFWMTGLGSLNSESVYGFEEGVPIEATVSRLQNVDFKLFPESDKLFSAKFWMLHGWFHSLNSEGTFANTDPDVGIYAPEELGVHGGHHSGSTDLISGTDAGEKLLGTDRNERFNGFDGDDIIRGGLGDDSIWGGHGDDIIRGDLNKSSTGGNDMLYGGPDKDKIYGQKGSDRLFGGTEDDKIYGGAGNDLIRGGLGDDWLRGGSGKDTFVLAKGEGTDTITDLKIDKDTIVLYGGIASEDLSINQMNSNTEISFADRTLAVLKGIDADKLIAASNDVFMAV
ncbi:dockerin type I domain-containing protein [Myxosarcina sp. GI1]|uniref:dockerin type I domain-containing protein n=1 Tax=Myxosarcina sp. GI1 TaxID=1541065 RepID=UPI000562BF52|nr:dockerin type I domain-containing protein [Myxosarcina sp. GI1]